MCRLLKTTLHLYRERPRTKTLDIIARDTGLAREWLINFGGEASHDPGVRKVETLYVYLTGKQLEL